MRNEALINCLRKIKERYPGLSSRQMSVEAELANNAVAAILSGRTNPTPYTIKKLTDKWGTLEDYLAMMRLAGHLPPESDDSDLDITADELQAGTTIINWLRQAKGKDPISDFMIEDFFRIWDRLPNEGKKELIRLAKGLIKQQSEYADRTTGIEKRGQAEAG